MTSAADFTQSPPGTSLATYWEILMAADTPAPAGCAHGLIDRRYAGELSREEYRRRREELDP
jgi:hypothetical protein